MAIKNGMMSYVGKYRVLCEFDQETLKPIADDTFVSCTNGGQIYRFDQNKLVYYRPNATVKNVLLKFREAGVNIMDNGSTATEVIFVFGEADIDKVARIVGARTKGKEINPKSKVNLKQFKWYRTRMA